MAAAAGGGGGGGGEAKKPSKVAAAADAAEAIADGSSSSAALRSFALLLRILGAGGRSRGRDLRYHQHPRRGGGSSARGSIKKYLRADNFGICYTLARVDEMGLKNRLHDTNEGAGPNP